MGSAKKNMMKRLPIEELVDTYLNSDGETEETARMEIESRYDAEYEVRKYIRIEELEYLQEELRRFVREERHKEVTPLEAWKEYKRSLEEPLPRNSELAQKILSMHPELKCLVQ